MMRYLLGVVFVSGRVQGTFGYWGDYWTAFGTSDRLFYFTQTEVVVSSEQVNCV